jgi:hypothetical protein
VGVDLTMHITRTEELYTLTGVDPLEPQRDPWAKLGGQLATGSGKTKMMSLLIAWAYLNAVLESENTLGFGRHTIRIMNRYSCSKMPVENYAPQCSKSISARKKIEARLTGRKYGMPSMRLTMTLFPTHPVARRVVVDP